MDCKSAGKAIQEYLDGEASDQIIADMQEHLIKCPRCRAYLESMKELMVGLDNLGLVEPEPDFSERVLSRAKQISDAEIAATAKPQYGWLQVLLTWAKGAAVMACVVIAFGMVSVLAPAAPATAKVFSTDPAAELTVAGKQVTVPPGLTIHGNLTVVDGNVTIAGVVQGDVRVIRGSVDKNSAGKIEGHVIAVDSPVAQVKDAALGALDWFVSIYNRAVRKMVGP
jgi:anti-sigma factor RsiW